MEDRNNAHTKMLARAAEQREHGDEVRLRREKELEAEISELRLALEPFANAAFNCEHEDDWERNTETTFTVGECRAARRAIMGRECAEMIEQALKDSSS